MLRGHIPRAWTRIPWTGAAGAAAVRLAIAIPALVPDGAPARAWAGAGVTARLAMGARVGLVTGHALTRLRAGATLS